MYEQLDIFSYIRPQASTKYCFDDDINEIRDLLLKLSSKYNLAISKDEFGIWSHVPQYGYRLDFGMEIIKEILQDDNFHKEVEYIVDFSKKRNVELDPMWGGIFFFSNKETATISFYTTFMDGKRRKIKNLRRANE